MGAPAPLRPGVDARPNPGADRGRDGHADHAGRTAGPGSGGGLPTPRPPLRITVLDVGQGDSILLEPRRGDPVLVDAGPPDSGVAEQLADRGIDRLAALVETHPQSDHVGGAPAVLDRLEVERLVFARADRSSLGAARAAGAVTIPVAAGDRLRSGLLRLEVIWPPPERLRAASGEDPNLLSLVLLARWRRFEILLTGDAEAEVAPVAMGAVDVLKVAHHGSEDAGLDNLLGRARPRLALISVGADNPYGHPAREHARDALGGRRAHAPHRRGG